MNKSLRVLILILLFGLATGCRPDLTTPIPTTLAITPPPGIPTLEGKLLNQVNRLEDALPRARSEGFVVPTDADLALFSRLISDLRAGSPTDALTAAASRGYELFWYADKNDEGAVSYLLRESDPASRGWGLYVLRVLPASDVIIEAPHPISDDGTPAVAVKMFRALDARALLIAGAHRDANKDGSADAAHSPQTVFEAVHEAELQAVLDNGAEAIVLQVHGFASNKHPEYPQVILAYEHGSLVNAFDLLKGPEIERKKIGRAHV